MASDASGLPRVEDELLTPLAFSTDLARSVDPGLPAPLEDLSAEGDAIDPLRSARLRRTVLQRDGARWKSVRAGGPVYGLVNVRTDGERILCATLDERDQTWRIQTFKSRF